VEVTGKRKGRLLHSVSTYLRGGKKNKTRKDVEGSEDSSQILVGGRRVTRNNTAVSLVKNPCINKVTKKRVRAEKRTGRREESCRKRESLIHLLKDKV